MNILIFTKNYLYQFEAYKSWASDFMLEPDLYAKDSRLVEELIDRVTQSVDFDVLKLKYKDIPCVSPHTLSPSEDYGIAVFDCVGKTIHSINQYTRLDGIGFDTINLLLLRNYFAENKQKKLGQIKALIETGVFSAGEEKDKITLQRINDFLSNGRLSEKDHQSIVMQNWMDRPFKLVPHSSQWRASCTLNYQKLSEYKKILNVFKRRKIALSAEQEKSWVTYYGSQLDDTAQTQTALQQQNALSDWFEKTRIKKEKQTLSKNVVLSKPDQNKAENDPTTKRNGNKFKI